MEDNRAFITIAAALLAALIAFAIAYWVWPWLGPQVFQPCPQWTSLGIGLYMGWMVFKTLGNSMRNAETADIKRRLNRLEARR